MIGLAIGPVLVIAMLLAAATAIFWPLREQRRQQHVERGEPALTIARDAKLGELTDLELDYRLGKLSDEDYDELNSTVRGEAIEIIRQLDAPAHNGNGNGNGGRPRSRRR